ncbi:MAG: N-acetylglucosamine-6-phosphate deacetylase [Chloroflexota bacterium]
MRDIVEGRLVLAHEVVPGRLILEDGWIAEVHLEPDNRDAAAGPYVAPGFIDVHCHGWGGHDATGDANALTGMAHALLKRGVTSFLPTAPTLPADEIPRFADRVRAWMAKAPTGGAQPLGFNLEGPFIAPARKGAHDPALLRTPADLDPSIIDAALEGLRIMTIAPELAGSLELIARLAALGIAPSIGHSGATLEEARAGFAAGGRTTTHLFNAMSGVDHRLPGLAVAALTDDAAYVELIADGNHVHPALWPIIARTKPADRLILVSDALPFAGTGDGFGRVGGLEVEVRDGRATLVGTTTLAGSVIALDTAVRNLVGAGISLPAAVAAASTNPAALLGETDRGLLEVGRRSHIVELDDDLRPYRVTRGGGWLAGAL